MKLIKKIKFLLKRKTEINFDEVKNLEFRFSDIKGQEGAKEVSR